MKPKQYSDIFISSATVRVLFFRRHNNWYSRGRCSMRYRYVNWCLFDVMSSTDFYETNAEKVLKHREIYQ